jgi:hypothetical protein
MIRFRFREDETRFVKLHAEMFERLARAGLNDVVGSETLRNVGKIEQMAFMEGVRQGLALGAIVKAMAASEEMSDVVAVVESLKAFQVHAHIYGSADTPLREAEKEWLAKVHCDETYLAASWLDNKPMRFAPATLRELEGAEPPVAPMMSIKAATKPTPVMSPEMTPESDESPPPRMEDLKAALDVALAEMPPPEAMHGAEVTPVEPWQKGEYEPDEVQPESPDFLDLARDAIQTLKQGGWDPKTWQDLVLGLHRQMHVDAGFLDLQLTTHVGRAVLDQCGLAGLAPPEMVAFDFFGGSGGRMVPGDD